MVRKEKSARPGHICVTFELPNSFWAHRVYVTGDFVNTAHKKVPMRQERDGSWRLTLHLPVGNQYKYRYQIDQQWYTEWNADALQAKNPDPNFSLLNLEQV